jgi:hypothetical protein
MKSDLFEFIATVQEDAQPYLNSSRTAEEEEKITEDERILSEFRNDQTTYSEVTNI